METVWADRPHERRAFAPSGGYDALITCWRLPRTLGFTPDGKREMKDLSAGSEIALARHGALR